MLAYWAQAVAQTWRSSYGCNACPGSQAHAGPQMSHDRSQTRIYAFPQETSDLDPIFFMDHLPQTANGLLKTPSLSLIEGTSLSVAGFIGPKVPGFFGILLTHEQGIGMKKTIQRNQAAKGCVKQHPHSWLRLYTLIIYSNTDICTRRKLMIFLIFEHEIPQLHSWGYVSIQNNPGN